MSLIALVGDYTTTTTLALAASWPTDSLVVVEADRSGGSLAAWLDTPVTPSLATIVASGPASTPMIESMIHHSVSGVRFIAAPIRARAAATAIDEATSSVFPSIASMPATTVIADTGHRGPNARGPSILSLASQVVVCHRQEPASAAAATVRIDRLTELIESLTHLDLPIVLTTIGTEPFDPDEVASFVKDAVPHADLIAQSLPHDPLAAAVLAGRTGVSAKRLQRLPLMRAAADLATLLQDGPPRPTQADPLLAQRSGTQ